VPFDWIVGDSTRRYIFHDLNDLCGRQILSDSKIDIVPVDEALKLHTHTHT
jgi:hypothetical protein